MEIRDARQPQVLVAFQTIKDGATFLAGENLFIRAKIPAATGEAIVNAVALSNGQMYRFADGDTVSPVKAHIVRET